MLTLAVLGHTVFFSMIRVGSARDFGAGFEKTHTLRYTYMYIQYMCAATFYGSIAKCE